MDQIKIGNFMKELRKEKKLTQEELPETFWVGFLEGATVSMALAAMIFGILYVTGRLNKVTAFKKRLLKGKQ